MYKPFFERFVLACRPKLLLVQFYLSTFVTLSSVDPLTGEQPGKYAGANGAPGKGYKGKNEERFTADT